MTAYMFYNFFLPKMGCHYYWMWPLVYLFSVKFCIFSRKLHDIFCIVCSFMLHNLHRTYIPHLWYIKQNSWWDSLINLHSFKSTPIFTALELQYIFLSRFSYNPSFDIYYFKNFMSVDGTWNGAPCHGKNPLGTQKTARETSKFHNLSFT